MKMKQLFLIFTFLIISNSYSDELTLEHNIGSKSRSISPTIDRITTKVEKLKTALSKLNLTTSQIKALQELESSLEEKVVSPKLIRKEANGPEWSHKAIAYLDGKYVFEDLVSRISVNGNESKSCNFSEEGITGINNYDINWDEVRHKDEGSKKAYIANLTVSVSGVNQKGNIENCSFILQEFAFKPETKNGHPVEIL